MYALWFFTYFLCKKCSCILGRLLKGKKARKKHCRLLHRSLSFKLYTCASLNRYTGKEQSSELSVNLNVHTSCLCPGSHKHSRMLSLVSGMTGQHHARSCLISPGFLKCLSGNRSQTCLNWYIFLRGGTCLTHVTGPLFLSDGQIHRNR